MDALFEVTEAAPDPIFGIWKAYQSDPNPKKVDLSIGIYHVESGAIEKLKIVREVEAEIAAELQKNPQSDSPDYLPIDGLQEYCVQSRKLLFGEKSKADAEGRIISLQTVGSSGALRNVADFLKRIMPAAPVLVSDPSWGNHRLIFERAGHKVETYPYYNAATGKLEVEAMLQKFNSCPQGSMLILQPSSHNPTGIDLDDGAWLKVAEIVKTRKLVAIFDAAYQGLGIDLDKDVAAVRAFEQQGVTFFALQSFSKTLSMYNRRCGVLHYVAPDAEHAKRTLSQIKTDIRANTSNPPVDGARVVARILGTPKYRKAWEDELKSMCQRLDTMREELVAALDRNGLGERFAAMRTHRGIFSYTGMSKQEMQALREKYSIYALDSGRICVASLTAETVGYVAESIAAVLKK